LAPSAHGFLKLSEALAAIRHSPPFKHILIRPRPGGGLTWAKAKYHSVHGMIETDWKIVGADFRLNVSLPVNTAATVWLPIAATGEIHEGRRPAEDAEGVRLVRRDGTNTMVRVGSGHYEFSGPLAR